LESLRESGGFLDPERSNRYGYMTANDLGMVFLIFRLAERAFSPLIKPPENEGGNKIGDKGCKYLSRMRANNVKHLSLCIFTIV
jgi:hypothetical protein